MGERSQIYLRYRTKTSPYAKSFSTVGFIAKYYQWCYGECMISRCRSLIEKLEDLGSNNSYFHHTESMQKLNATFDINWDMQDMVCTTDIIKEVMNNFTEGDCKAEEINVFAQDCGHAQLFIDIIAYNNGKYKIKYAFCPYYDKDVMNVEEFANYDMGNGSDREYNPEETPRPWYIADDYHSTSPEMILSYAKIVKYTKDNMEYINNSATVMTNEEKEEFVEWGKKYGRCVASYGKEFGEKMMTT